MGNISISKKDLKRIIEEEKYRYSLKSRNLTKIEEGMYKNAAKRIILVLENSEKIDKEIEVAIENSSLSPGAMTGEFIKNQMVVGAEFAAKNIEELNNSGATQLFGDGFITTLRVDIIKFLMKMFSFPRSDILAQSLASIPFTEWPALIDNWETTGCDVVTDAIVRGVSVSASKAATDTAFKQFAKLPIIGGDLESLRKSKDGAETRLSRVVRQMGTSAALENIEEIAGMRSAVRAYICDIDVKNLNLGNIDQLKTSLLGVLSMVGVGGGTEIIKKLKDRAGEISQLSPKDAAEILGKRGGNIEDIDDVISIEDIVSTENLAEPPEGYNKDYWDRLEEIADETLPDASLEGLESWVRSQF